MLEDISIDELVPNDVVSDIIGNEDIVSEELIPEIIYIAPDIDLDFIYAYMTYSLIALGIISSLILVLIFIQGWEAKAKG